MRYPACVADPTEPSQETYEAVLADTEHLLDQVDRALSRLEEGSFGTCQVCGGPVDEERLVHSPLAGTCAAHPQLDIPGS